MEFFVDIADVDAVKRVSEYYPIDGFTTNPNILTKSEQSLEENMREYKEYIVQTGFRLFVQVTAKTAPEMVEQAKKLKAYFGEKLVVKLPAVKEGFKACMECRKLDIPVCITVVHSVLQALMAAKAGAEYAAPYVSHIDNIGADGVREVGEMVKAFDRYGYSCKVLGASFRTADQIEKLAAVGCHAVTITPQFFDLLIEHPSTDVSLNGFYDVWEKKYGKEQISDAIPRK